MFAYSRTTFLSFLLPLVLLVLIFVEFQKQIKSLIPAKKNNNNNKLRLDLKDELHNSNNTLDGILHDNNNDNSTSLLSSNNNHSSSSSSMKRALDCLRHTKPVPNDLLYPEDAYEHFQEIHQRLDQWTQKKHHQPHHAAGFRGPWIENHWITHFQNELSAKSSNNNNNNNNNNTRLSDIFGPYIPLFIPWTDIWVRNGFKYPKALVQTMMREDFLRDDVLYITVNQNDDGFVGRCSEFDALQRNKLLTIFSAGGYGHIPIPLLKQPERSLPQKKSPRERKHLLSYVGSTKNAPGKMRQKMIAQGHHYYHGEHWREEMAQSKFQLCPRGFGRTSYHVQETLQMGLIPIQIYLDQPWLPYGTIMKNISYAVTVEELPELVDTVLSKLTDVEISHMEQQIESWRHEYFSVEGTLQQIGTFLLQQGDDDDDAVVKRSDLLCQALPDNAGSGETRMKACG